MNVCWFFFNIYYIHINIFLISPWKYIRIPLSRPLLGLSKSGLISGVVLILNIECSKRPKISSFFCLTFAFMQLFLKILSGMANSVDPDQTAPEGAV